MPAFAKLKKCMAGYDADLRLYTTPIAMDDLDDVRAYLGYDTINIYGGSYGTRAALVYLRQHGDRVRTAVLDGVAPTNMRLPLFFPRDVQRAFDRLIADCDSRRRVQRAVSESRRARPRAGRHGSRREPPLVSVVASTHRRARRDPHDGAHPRQRLRRRRCISRCRRR